MRTVRVRLPEAAAFALLAMACLVSVWPILRSGSIPAFQQDWTWPLSRGLSLQWLHAFIGLWDPRGLGQANPLPWETYAVVLQVAFILIFGPSLGLAVWIVALEFGAGYACWRMLATLSVPSVWARFTAALFYAAGPVVFTRVAAGHLAYLIAYALLPLVVLFAKQTIENAGLLPSALLGLLVGLSGSQIQFLAIDWLVVLPLVPVVRRIAGWPARLLLAAGVAIAVQLQALLPLAISSTTSLYLAQRALISWEYNNSSPFSAAIVMLGYFTHYYESHALPWAQIALYVLAGIAAVGAMIACGRLAAYAYFVATVGILMTAGLYGPLSGPLIWAFAHSAYFTVFRDLHYFAALTSLGVALLIGLALQRFGFATPALLLLVMWSVEPTLAGSDLSSVLVPRRDVRDAVGDMRAVHIHGPGRVLWLPAEEPLRLRRAANAGRDFAAYGPPGNPSVSDDLQNPQLAYALAMLREGKPDWWAFQSMGIRYLVYRRYIRSASEEDNLGTGFRLAYAKLNDTDLGAELAGDRRLEVVSRTTQSIVYALRRSKPTEYEAEAYGTAMLYSELQRGQVALAPQRPSLLHVRPSEATADPRLGWVSGAIGWRYRWWLPDSIYPFVWTVSGRTLTFDSSMHSGCVLSASESGARLVAGNVSEAVRGRWQRYSIGQSRSMLELSLEPLTRTTTALSVQQCDLPEHPVIKVAVMAAGYDRGWRAMNGWHLIKPWLANGWMMAWPESESAKPKLYLPAVAQGLGIASLILAIASLLWLRNRPAP
jgi:hypothetical protein